MTSDIPALLRKIDTLILNPLILLLFGVALVVFLWGIFKFLSHTEEGGEEREGGKKSMLWGIIGMTIMVGVYGIISIILNTFGVSTPDFISR